jgi:hypothetical protein
MDSQDLELIRRLLPEHPELRALWEEHQALEGQLARLDGLRFLTPEEELKRKEIQKRKLAGRDRIQAILARCR